MAGGTVGVIDEVVVDAVRPAGIISTLEEETAAMKKEAAAQEADDPDPNAVLKEHPEELPPVVNAIISALEEEKRRLEAHPAAVPEPAPTAQRPEPTEELTPVVVTPTLEADTRVVHLNTSESVTIGQVGSQLDRIPTTQKTSIDQVGSLPSNVWSTEQDGAAEAAAKLDGWLAPAFVSAELEAAFQEDRLHSVAAPGRNGIRAMVVVSLLPLLRLCQKGDVNPWPSVLCSGTALVLSLMFWSCLMIVPQVVSSSSQSSLRLYDVSVVMYSLAMVLVCSMSPGRLEKSFSDSARSETFGDEGTIIIGAILTVSGLFMEVSSKYYLLLFHLAIIVHAAIAAGVSGATDSCSDAIIDARRASLWQNIGILYLLAWLLHSIRRGEEVQGRRAFANVHFSQQQLDLQTKRNRLLAERSERLDELCKAFQEGHDLPEASEARLSGPSGKSSPPPSSPEPAEPADSPKMGGVMSRAATPQDSEARPMAAVMSRAATLVRRPSKVGLKVDPPAPPVPRDLTVPPPPLRADLESTPKRPTANLKGSRAPNALLVSAMSGRQADWDRIRRMAEQIRSPSYGIRAFFEDCVHSFPELALFFDGAPQVVGTRGLGRQRKADSGLSGEAEYQRTVGALFTVYWMLRLDTVGPAGFCYGVDEDWSPIVPSAAAPQGKSFFKMTADEKRASFLETMDWKPFEDLVARAGCARDAPGSAERIVALLCLTSFHDIMKLPTLQPIVQPQHAPYNGYEAGVRIHDHDMAISYVLEHFPKLLPSYDGLSAAQQRAVLFTQGKMQFNHGWFVQAEAPPGGMLSKFKAVLGSGIEHQADVDLYFLHWITDLAGAEATPLGGAEKLVLKFPHTVLASFLWSMPYLSRLSQVSETALVEGYLEARWRVLLPKEPVPLDGTAIAVMRLAVMAQGEDPLTVVEAFRALPATDQACLVTELSRTGCEGQTFARHVVAGGPAFLVYYSPALLQRNNNSQKELEVALHTLCVVLRGARAVWPMSLKAEGSTVIIQIGELKSQDIANVVRDPGGDLRSVWVLLRNNDHEGNVTLCRAGELNALYMEGSRFRVLDFTMEPEESDDVQAAQDSGRVEVNIAADGSPMTGLPSMLGLGKRVLVFTDMSTECDDECAVVWLLAALNRRRFATTVELVQTDTHVRFQWMAHIFSDKFAPGGEWEVMPDGCSFRAGNVLVNMYLAHSPKRETMVIDEIKKKAPHLQLDFTEEDGKKTAVRRPGMIGGEDYSKVPAGPLNSIVIAAAIPDCNPKFFDKFTDCRCVYVVGTPGGINCPMPSWVDLLAGMHKLAPVLYLTPQLTRTVRFPRNYVITNSYWNETMKHTVWDAALTFMARRPEIPPKFGNWGLILRLNVANAMFCKDWYNDVMNANVEEAERPAALVRATAAYVDRNSALDRDLGAVVEELKMIGIDMRKIIPDGLDAHGKPTTKEAAEAVRAKYREQLHECVFTCVLTTDTLIFRSERNTKVGVDAGGFETMQARCGYKNPEGSLGELFGPDEALKILMELPIRRLTPAYDVVGMICADSSLEENPDVDGGLGLVIKDADSTMGLEMLSEEQRGLSDFPVLMTPPQSGAGIYGVGPFG